MSSVQFSSVQLLSCVRLFVTPWIPGREASLSTTNSWSSPKPMSIESVMPSSHLILCCPLFLLPPIPPSIRVFSNESTLRMRWSKYWSFSLSISPSNEYPGLVSFRMDWLDLLAVQGTFKTLLQHHSSKASILQCSVFFMVQLSHLYMTTGKTIVLTRWTFVGKVMSLLFNMLSRLVIDFLPRNKHLLFFIFVAAVTICSDYGAQENKACHCFHCFPIYLPWRDGTGCHDQFFVSSGQSIGASTSASIIPMSIQDWFPLGWLVGSACSSRNSQEFSPTPQFKSINSLALSFPCGPTLISIHDYWENHSFD